MSLIQSEHAKGRLQAPIAAEAGNAVTARYEIDLAAAVAADVIELGILPAYSRITDAILVSDGLGGAVTVDVGLLSDVPGETDAATTAGAELFDAAAISSAAVVRTSLPAGFLLATSETDRAVGMNVSAEATGKVILFLTYVANGDY